MFRLVIDPRAVGLVIVVAAAVQGCAGTAYGEADELPLSAPPRTSSSERDEDKARAEQSGVVSAAPADVECKGVDLTTDSENCGRCNHSCLGAACVASKCQPITLASNLAIPQGLAVTRDGVYVTLYGGNKIVRLSKSNENQTPETISADTAQPWAIAAIAESDNTRLVWGELRGSSSNVSFCSTKPSCAATVQKVNAAADVRQISISGTFAYWAAGGSIQRCGIAGCTSSFPVITNQPSLLYGVVVSGGQLAFSIAQSAGIVRRASSAGNGITDLIPALDSPQTLATDGTNLYVVANGSAVIARCPLTGCTNNTSQASTIALANNPHGVTVDDKGNVYWTNGLANNGGSIAFCNPNSGANSANACSGKGIELAKEQANPFTIAVDESAVYWTSSVPNGSVMKIARP